MIPIYKTGNSRAAVGEGGGGAWRTFHIMFLPFPLSSSPCTPALQGSEEFSVKTPAPSHLFIDICSRSYSLHEKGYKETFLKHDLFSLNGELH